MEEYLNDKDFEINRRQYIAEKEAKKGGGKATNGSTNTASKASEPRPSTASQPASQPISQPQTAPQTNPNANAPLIDLFASLEDNQQIMATQAPMQQQYPQQTGFDQGFQQQAFQQPSFQMPQQTANDMAFGQQQQPFMAQNSQGTNPFQMQQQQQLQQQPMQPQFTGAGFGGYTPQPFSPQNGLAPIPQNGVPDFSQQQQMQLPTIAEPIQQQPTSTNPFRQSMLPSMTGVAEPKLLSNPTGASSLGRSATNPFAKQTTGFQQQSPPPMSGSPFGAPSFQSSPFAQPQPQPLQPTPTGTNPFARNASPQNATSPPGGLSVNATGSTNPFRQSAFVNQQTGQGWQNSGGGTIGGMSMDQVPTQSVFPRPGQQQQQNFLG